jgi:hypothetical protein
MIFENDARHAAAGADVDHAIAEADERLQGLGINDVAGHKPRTSCAASGSSSRSTPHQRAIRGELRKLLRREFDLVAREGRFQRVAGIRIGRGGNFRLRNVGSFRGVRFVRIVSHQKAIQVEGIAQSSARRARWE